MSAPREQAEKRGFNPADLISGALVMPYGALMYALGGWALTAEISGAIIFVAVCLIVWRTVREGLEASSEPRP